MRIYSYEKTCLELCEVFRNASLAENATTISLNFTTFSEGLLVIFYITILSCKLMTKHKQICMRSEGLVAVNIEVIFLCDTTPFSGQQNFGS
jgi:hypothetical protein